MTALSVNLNKVALLRNARDGGLPDVSVAAQVCIDAGAHGITLHPRPDMRHVRPADVTDIHMVLSNQPDIEYNIEGNPFEGPVGAYPGFMQLVREVRPTQVTLVPDTVGQLTSDHGWDIAADSARLQPLIEELTTLGSRVSLFMDPAPEAMSAVADLGAQRVELYTEGYARAHARGDAAGVLAQYREAAIAAQTAGLGVNAGHDLNEMNLKMFLNQVPSVLEVSIGHAIISESLYDGLSATVLRYLACIPSKG